MAADYLDDVLDPKQQKVFLHQAMQTLRGVEFDTIACSGVSGIVMGAILSRAFFKPLTVVRKPDDQSNHSSRSVETNLDLGNPDVSFLVVDDFMLSGRTRNRILAALNHWRFAGLYSYLGDKLVREEEFEPALPLGVRTTWTSKRQLQLPEESRLTYSVPSSLLTSSRPSSAESDPSQPSADARDATVVPASLGSTYYASLAASAWLPPSSDLWETKW